MIGVVVLANLSSHERVAAQMVHIGVLDLIIKISEAFPDIIELQRSCLGCISNLMNDPSNAIAFLDRNGHMRVRVGVAMGPLTGRGVAWAAVCDHGRAGV